jgi:tetrahydromethanopterin S-methyltransferase subunit D
VLQDFLRASLAASSAGVVGKFLASVPVGSAPAATAAAAARICGITDLSTATSAGIANYIASGPWTANQAAGTLALVCLSPEFSVN